MANVMSERGYSHSRPSINRPLMRIEGERKWKRNIALALGAALLVIGIGVTYLVYSEIPAPGDPANNAGFLTEPHHPPAY